MKCWAGLLPEGTHNLVTAGTDMMMKVTKSILDGTWPVKRLKPLTGGDEMEANQEKAMIVQVPGMRGGA
jgi:hypothetical protein